MEKDDFFLMEWKLIAKELNLQVEIPYTLNIDGKLIEVNLLLRNFGGIPGTIIVNDYDKIKDYTKKFGSLGFSVFSTPPKFEPLLTAQEKEEIIYMLSEWGWTGPEDEKPSWLLNDIDHEEDIS